MTPDPIRQQPALDNLDSSEETAALLMDEKQTTTVQPPKHRTLLRDMTFCTFGMLLAWTLAAILPLPANLLHSSSSDPEIPWSPAKHVIRYHEQSADVYAKSPYAHPRTHEVDEAWVKLMAPINLRISREDMVAGSLDLDNAVEMADEAGGFIGGLTVYHNLHCLNLMRMVATPDFEAAEGMPRNVTVETEHLEHCIESLRRSVMCQGETAIWTAKWIRTEEGELDYDPQFVGQSRCVDWEGLEEWARPRALEGKRYLRQPKDGVV